MNWLQKFRLRLRALVQKQKLDAQMDEEMRSHIEMQARDNIEAGMTPEEARYAAMRQFGWVESIKESCREQRGMIWLEDLAQDVRFGARMLRKNPGFTAIVLLTLALGIGAVSSVFSLVRGVLLTPSPYSKPEQIVLINSVRKDGAPYEAQENSKTRLSYAGLGSSKLATTPPVPLPAAWRLGPHIGKHVRAYATAL